MPKSESKSLKDFEIPVDTIKAIYEKKIHGKAQIAELNFIFQIALADMSLFPNINNASSCDDYLERWIKGYNEAIINTPSGRIATLKSSCSDPAIKTIVQYVTKVEDAAAELQSQHHNLFMSAENIQGNLLEEYISANVRPLGWYWCAGNVLRAVDFCTPNGPTLLQIKNKSNTENSSSSTIRAGTIIKKWYRLGTRTKNGIKIPDYKWNELNSIINQHTSNPSQACAMSEDSYQSFLAEVAKRNPRIITDK